MKPADLTSIPLPELLGLHGAILAELKRRKISRTENNPTGDYAEYLVAQKLGLRLEENSELGFDATDDKGIRYQIKGRRLTPGNRSTQLGAIRKLKEHEFDYLIGVLFDEVYRVQKVAKLPHVVVGEYAKYRSHPNAHILLLNKAVLSDNRIEDLTKKFTD